MSFTLDALEPRMLLSAGLGNPNNIVVAFDTTEGTIEVELFDNLAPNTVDNFLNYVNSDRYDNTLIHRSVPGFVIQGGGYYYTAATGSDPVVTDLPVADEPFLPSVTGTLSMARTGVPNSATSQWFFNLDDNLSLDNPDPSDPISVGGFTVFGAVRDATSFGIVQAINNLDTHPFAAPFNELPVQPAFDPLNIPVPLPESLLVFLTDVRVLGTVGDLGGGVAPAPDAEIDAEFNANRLVVTLPNEEGQAVRYISNDSGATWTVSAASTIGDEGDEGGELAAWTASNGDRFSAQIADGAIRVTRAVGGALTTVTVGANLTGDVYSVQQNNGRVSLIAYSNAGGGGLGAMVLYTQTGAVDADGDPLWTGRSLTGDDFATFSESTPLFTSEVVTLNTSWDAQIFAGIDPSGDLQAVWFANGLPQDKYRVNNLSTNSGAEAIVGGLSVFETPWNAITFTGASTSGELVAIWWAPGFGSSWQYSNFADLFAAQTVDTSQVGSFILGNQLNIVAIDDASGDLVLFTWTPSRIPDAWLRQVALSSGSVGFVAPVSDLRPVVDSDGDVSVFAVSAAGDLIRFAWDVSANTWGIQNVTGTASFV